MINVGGRGGCPQITFDYNKRNYPYQFQIELIALHLSNDVALPMIGITLTPLPPLMDTYKALTIYLFVALSID